MKATATKIKVERKSSRIPNHLVITMNKYHPCKQGNMIQCHMKGVCVWGGVYLCMLIVEGVKLLGYHSLLTKRSDGRETLQGGGDVRVHWTSSYMRMVKCELWIAIGLSSNSVHNNDLFYNRREKIYQWLPVFSHLVNPSESTIVTQEISPQCQKEESRCMG